mmetsp:Transcript_13863/g.30146  ORF Transcript_13863/g.30146 Transcript_13863/m.30146 type:complete len:591 (-) Transcript_13863:2143-3915(-)
MVCVDRANWLSQAVSRLVPDVYNIGPIGVPQPFETLHGEWGPPIGKSSDIDWELYSVVLICCDTILTMGWHMIAGSVLRAVRVKWMSPTFRVSLGYIFGSVRLSMVIYFFRARPDAAYTYLHSISFLLHFSLVLVALLFGDGPWGHLRPNRVGVFEQDNMFNVYAKLQSLWVGFSHDVEYYFWGMLQYFVKAFPRGSMLLGLLSIRLDPGSQKRFRIPSPPQKVGRRKSLSVDTGIEPVVSLKTDSPSSWSDDGVYFLSDDDTDSDSDVDGEDRVPAPPPHPSLFLSNPRGPTVVIRDPAVGGKGERWFLEKSATALASREVVLVGPGKFNLRVSKTKWNESILFWVKPTLLNYFSRKIPASQVVSSPSLKPQSKPPQRSLSPPRPPQYRTMEAKREPTIDGEIEMGMFLPDHKTLQGGVSSTLEKVSSPKKSPLGGWSALDEFVSRSAELDDSDDEDEQFSGMRGFLGIPIRGTVLIRGDGVLLSISAAAPNIRNIVEIATREFEGPLELREVVVELIGRRVSCNSGKRVVYTYAEYTQFGMTLRNEQKSCLLWLLNKLNDNAKVPFLRTYRNPNYIDSGDDFVIVPPR